MRTHELEDLTLLLLSDAATEVLWLDRWALSYPVAVKATVCAGQSLVEWQAAVAAAWQSIGSEHIMVVAHGSAVLAWMAWLYQADVIAQKRLCGMLLAAPDRRAWQEDAAHTLSRARINCRAALVVAANDACCPRDWAAALAQSWGARFFTAPQRGHLNGHLHGWQWGMKLMQEMLLSD